MPFPERFRSLIELREGQVTTPDFVWLSYSVCAVDDNACGWQGWVIESARKVGENHKEVEVKADAEQGCPQCQRPLFRTGVEKKFRLDGDVEPTIIPTSESEPIELTASKTDERLELLKPLSGRTFVLTAWTPLHPGWTHDHCWSCQAHICGADDSDFHEAFVTTEGRRQWVCPKCFELYRSMLDFRLADLSRP